MIASRGSHHKALTTFQTQRISISPDTNVSFVTPHYSVEPVEIIYEDGRQPTGVTPDLSSRTATAKVDYINGCTGLKLSPDEICGLLNKMSLEAEPSKKDKNEVVVQVPPTRSDVLHQCDIMEDVAIAYGFNNLERTTPAVSTVGKPYPLNKLADTARLELALAGWSEVSPLTLVCLWFTRVENLIWSLWGTNKTCYFNVIS